VRSVDRKSVTATSPNGLPTAPAFEHAPVSQHALVDEGDAEA
jgi:hypothetical protein